MSLTQLGTYLIFRRNSPQRLRMKCTMFAHFSPSQTPSRRRCAAHCEGDKQGRDYLNSWLSNCEGRNNGYWNREIHVIIPTTTLIWTVTVIIGNSLKLFRFTRHCAKSFIHIFPFHFHRDPIKILLMAPFYGGWDSIEVKKYT